MTPPPDPTMPETHELLTDDDLIERFKSVAGVQDIAQFCERVCEGGAWGHVRETVITFGRHLIKWTQMEARVEAKRTAARESDAAARIAAQREAASRAWDAAMKWYGIDRQSSSFVAKNVARDAYLDREHPLPARECVRCALCDQSGADLSTGTHATRDECIEALGAALKSFAAGVGR